MSKINSRAKGARGELEAAKFLTDHGHPARRGQQYQGAPDSPDVICESLDRFHLEIKRTEALSLYKAMDQATEDAGDKVPLVLHRRNGKEWLVILRAEDFLEQLDG